jgi:hypothetical protein
LNKLLEYDWKVRTWLLVKTETHWDGKPLCTVEVIEVLRVYSLYAVSGDVSLFGVSPVLRREEAYEGQQSTSWVCELTRRVSTAPGHTKVGPSMYCVF